MNLMKARRYLKFEGNSESPTWERQVPEIKNIIPFNMTR